LLANVVTSGQVADCYK